MLFRSVHVFESTLWWTDDDFFMQTYVIGIVLFLESSFMAVLCYCSIKRDYQPLEGPLRLAPAWMQLCATSGVFGVAWMVTLLVYMQNRGCRSFALDAEPLLIAAWMVTLASLATSVYLWLHAYKSNRLACGIFSWLTLYFAMGLVIMACLQQFNDRVFNSWALQDRKVPVMVSALGTDSGSVVWKFIWD